MKYEFIDILSPQICRDNPTKLYVFGDNLMQVGKGGQAIIRDEPNAYGIPTKRKPSMSEDAFFSDKQEEFDVVLEALSDLRDEGYLSAPSPIDEDYGMGHYLEQYETVVLPIDMVGTGLAMLPEKSPKIFELIKLFWMSREGFKEEQSPVFMETSYIQGYNIYDVKEILKSSDKNVDDYVVGDLYEILLIAEKNMNAELGFNWEDISLAIQCYEPIKSLKEKEEEKELKVKILYNAIRTPDGTILESTHVHDFRTHVDKTNGKEYMVDGGNFYLKRNAHNDYEELSLNTLDDIEKIRGLISWASYGVDGNEPRKVSLIKELSDEHLDALIDGKWSECFLLPVFIKEKEYRKEKGIVVGRRY